MFIDHVTLNLIAGKGGNGVIAWRREKYIPKGGPAGGNGGIGGSVLFVSDPQCFSLEDYRNKRILKAESGGSGGSNNRSGKNGKHLELKIPLGTLIKDAATGVVLCDCTEPGQEYLVCRGGRGGKGNTHFKTSTRQAPYICTEGTYGESLEVELELKMIADVGLVGMPNAGKSTLISKLAHISVKIAPYPFTTLRPNIGVVEFDDFSRLMIADIPGLIRDAAEDRGLGISFLKHIERTRCIVYVLELAPHEGRDPYEDLLILQNELRRYDEALLEKPFLIALNKIDQEGAQELIDSFKKRYTGDPSKLFEISALERKNLLPLKQAIRALSV